YLQDLGGVAIEPWHISHKAIGQQCAAQLNAEMLKDELVRQNQQHNIAGLESILNNLDSILSTYIRNITPPPEAL
ncbi:D-alanyl-D-alanine carboxypeptidase family protein, partial [Vibrio sp. 1833]|nr:D-alanyl-D-alanine carboxypeptidase family protein [Vibrio sp. 1833]